MAVATPAAQAGSKGPKKVKEWKWEMKGANHDDSEDEDDDDN